MKNRWFPMLAGCVLHCLPASANAGDAYQFPFFPAASDRGPWQKVLNTPSGKKQAAEVIARAEKILSEPVPPLPASVFMRFRRKWNRIDYETLYFQRRHNMHTLVLAECMEYQGRFIDKIIDYLWEITSEHTWNLPAHLPYHPDPLPFLQHEHIALYSSVTGMDLAAVLLLLEKELGQVSENLVKLIQNELDRRIIEPLEIRPFPFGFLSATNNWRPWCCRNCLFTVLTRLKDQPQRRQKIVDLFKKSLQEYMDAYSDDGCCDEGPSYWGVNPLMIMSFYELLQEQPEDLRKFSLMGDYINNARLTREYFANFADSPVRVNLPAGACYRFGERTGNERLKNLGLYYAAHTEIRRAFSLFDRLCNLFWVPLDKTVDPVMEKTSLHYYERFQMLFLKERDLALAAKRGFRGSHYHMDIGQVIIFFREKPVIVDLGSAVYTAETFSKLRFRNWILNAEAHNVPQFNGVCQLESPRRDDRAASIRNDDRMCVLTMDLTSAYPPEAELLKCERIITCNRLEQSVEIEDRWELKRDNNTVRVPFYTPAAITPTDGQFRIADMVMSVSGNPTAVTVTEMTMTDSNVIANWGKTINRLDVVTTSGRRGGRKLRFVPIQ